MYMRCARVRMLCGASDVDDILGLLGDDDTQAAEDESNDSEGSVGPPTMGHDPESREDGAAILAVCAERPGAACFLALGVGSGNIANLYCST